MKASRQKSNSSIQILKNEDGVVFQVIDSSWNSFRLRAITKLSWLLFLGFVPVVYFWCDQGIDSLIITIPIPIVLACYGLFSSLKDRYLLMRVEMNIKKNKFRITTKKYDRQYADYACELDSIKSSLKELWLGESGTPRYSIVIQQGRKYLFQQKDNFVWSTPEIIHLNDSIQEHVACTKKSTSGFDLPHESE